MVSRHSLRPGRVKNLIQQTNEPSVKPACRQAGLRFRNFSVIVYHLCSPM
jgi:hypothetical protein